MSKATSFRNKFIRWSMTNSKPIKIVSSWKKKSGISTKISDDPDFVLFWTSPYLYLNCLLNELLREINIMKCYLVDEVLPRPVYTCHVHTSWCIDWLVNWPGCLFSPTIPSWPSSCNKPTKTARTEHWAQSLQWSKLKVNSPQVPHSLNIPKAKSWDSRRWPNRPKKVLSCPCK